MAESAKIRELVEFINSGLAIDWKAEAAHIAATVPFDPSPAFVVVYYPACDCGEPALEEQVLMSKVMTMYGYRYMDTCYECSVVSSD